MTVAGKYLVAWLAAALIVSPVAQVPGFAEILEPGNGQAVSGIITIFGTASHPAFESYDLAFSFDPDPTETWFPIGEALDTPVSDGRLGIWDTTEITDGVYRLRLRVNVEGAPAFEAVVGGIRVRNYTPTETPPPAAVTAVPTAVATIIATSSVSEAPESQEPPDRFSTALRVGVFLGLFLMLASVVYIRLAPRIRSYAGYVRMRQLHRRQDRARQRGSRRG